MTKKKIYVFEYKHLIEKKNQSDISSSESNDSLYTAFEYEVPAGFYLHFSKNKTPWILPISKLNWKYLAHKLVLYKIKSFKNV